MKKYIVMMLCLLLVGCSSPVIENDGQVSVEESSVDDAEEQLIGGQRDENGCLGPAGYAFDEEVGACVREWELEVRQLKAARIAVEHNGPEKGLTVVDVLPLSCDGCFRVNLEIMGEQREVNLEDWEVKR